MTFAPFNPLLRVPHNDPLQKEAWLDACRIVAWLGAEQPGCRVRAFGSLVRPGAWHPRSDIDLAVEENVESPWKTTESCSTELPQKTSPDSDRR